MHTVRRGKAPPALKPIRRSHTARWIAYYKLHVGTRPSDTKWTIFEPTLRKRFHALCVYCEEICKGEVDHFRPKSRYPHLVYSWDNWLFACHSCNNLKGETWIKGGYIDPCFKSKPKAEAFFEFDVETGQIAPSRTLSAANFRRARDMRDQLRLNAYHHLKKRLRWLNILEEALAGGDDSRRVVLMALVISRKEEFSSISRAYLKQRGLKFR